MINYIIRRLFYGVLLVFGVMTLVFFMLRILPGDPAIAALGENATSESLAMLREKWGLNMSVGHQYINYVVNLFKGDWGYSYSSNKSVSELIIYAFPYTFQLVLAALILPIVVGIPLGILTALKRNSFTDYAGRIISLCGLSMPSFYLGILLMILFSLKLKLLPSMGAGSLKALILPAFTGGIGIAAYMTRLSRSSILNVMREMYVTTARAKGLKESKVIFKHVLRSALITVVTFFGIYTIVLLGNTVLIETVFSRPGLGRLIVASTRQRDYMLLQGIMVVYTIFVVLVNILTDIIYAFIDPRIRLS